MSFILCRLCLWLPSCSAFFQHRSKHLKGPAWGWGTYPGSLFEGMLSTAAGRTLLAAEAAHIQADKEAEESVLKTGTTLNSVLPLARPHSLQTSTTSWGPRVQTQSNHNAGQERAGPWRAVTFPYGCVIPGLKTMSLSPEMRQSRCGHR